MHADHRRVVPGGDEPHSHDSERWLRAALHDAEAQAHGSTPTAIDGEATARRIRQRRTPRLFAAGAVASIAVLGLGTVAVQSMLPFLQPAIVASNGLAEDERSTAAGEPDAAESDGATTESGATELAPVIRCGEPVPAPSPAAAAAGLSLVLSVSPTARIADGEVPGEVLLTNTGADPLRATAPLLPTVLLTDGTTVLWHTHGVLAQVVTQLDLAPGESQSVPVTVEPLRCASEEQLERGTAHRLEPGQYELVTVLDLVLEDGRTLHLIGDPAAVRFD